MKLSSIDKAQELKGSLEFNIKLAERVKATKRLVLALDDGFRDGIWVDTNSEDGQALQAIFERFLARKNADIEGRLKALGVEL